MVINDTYSCKFVARAVAVLMVILPLIPCGVGSYNALCLQWQVPRHVLVWARCHCPVSNAPPTPSPAGSLRPSGHPGIWGCRGIPRAQSTCFCRGVRAKARPEHALWTPRWPSAAGSADRLQAPPPAFVTRRPLSGTGPSRHS